MRACNCTSGIVGAGDLERSQEARQVAHRGQILESAELQEPRARSAAAAGAHVARQ